MPWHISRNAYGCSGYAVVKDGTDEVAGCHKTRASAEAQVAALYASEKVLTSDTGIDYDWAGKFDPRVFWRKD